MFAQVSFIKAVPEGHDLSNTYDFKIDQNLADQLEQGDVVVIENSRTLYATGVFIGTSDTVEKPDIVTKSVIQKVEVPKFTKEDIA